MVVDILNKIPGCSQRDHSDGDVVDELPVENDFEIEDQCDGAYGHHQHDGPPVVDREVIVFSNAETCSDSGKIREGDLVLAEFIYKVIRKSDQNTKRVREDPCIAHGCQDSQQKKIDDCHAHDIEFEYAGFGLGIQFRLQDDILNAEGGKERTSPVQEPCPDPRPEALARWLQLHKIKKSDENQEARQNCDRISGKDRHEDRGKGLNAEKNVTFAVKYWMKFHGIPLAGIFAGCAFHVSLICILSADLCRPPRERCLTGSIIPG